MSQKPETQFSNKLHRLLGRSVYVEKMSNAYRYGLPDFYYEGESGILWCEHKFISKPWVTPVAAEDICKTKSWIHQHRWLTRAHKNNQNTCVIVGTPKVAAVLRYPYNFDPQSQGFKPLSHAVNYIESFVL